MNKRLHWEFSYKASDLVKAATDKVLFHEGRRKWWEDKRAGILTKIRAEGIEIDTSLIDSDSAALISNSSYRGPTVSIRDDLLRDLQECVAKVKDHDFNAKDYSGWIQVLSSQGGTSFPLNHDDWMFFFGK